MNAYFSDHLTGECTATEQDFTDATPGASHAEHRLLVPVKNGSDARRAITYAIRRRAEGCGVSVCLLHVEEQAESKNGEKFWSWKNPLGKTLHRKIFTPAMGMLSGLDIEVAAYVRYGAVVFTILDTAEELDCHEIVIPAPHAGVLRWLSRNVVTALLTRQRSVQVVLARQDGTAILL